MQPAKDSDLKKALVIDRLRLVNRILTAALGDLHSDHDHDAVTHLLVAAQALAMARTALGESGPEDNPYTRPV